ncbi:GNAT family N-acetyltransferase [Oceanicola sp. 502str15]|uniref:GNAT family N-acetyltransferase n=1 Tax=Oceanicola sp. 502str15 TaxID=2696061 RepID=UPI00209542A7|nr:GNAT family N-acetyltransferase [Oceanicola sp. 502str15]MCO6384360.1 GNAT family N-acetyltransferase [Oceanicola sp. 502str15]
MIRQAQPGEEARMEAFLAQHPNSSMFLRGNLETHGLVPGDHPHSSTFWMAETERGEIRAVVGCNNDGFLMAQVPEPLPGLWPAVAGALAGRRIAGMTGEDGQVQAAMEGLGLADAGFTLNHAEPLYRLDLARLTDPEAEIRPSRPEDEDMLRRWFAEHFLDTQFSRSKNQAVADARRRAARVVTEDNLRLLVEDGAPVGMAGVNARAGDMVQLGSVHVPRDLRRVGRGRRVTAALLAEERARGVATAVLFANNPEAARVYEAIGFERVGSYRIALLERPQPVRVMA